MAGWIALETDGLKEALAAMSRAERLDASKDLKREFDALVMSAITKGNAKASTRGQRRAARTSKPDSRATGAVLWFGDGFAGAMGHEFGAKQNTVRQSKRGSYLGFNQFLIWKGNDEHAGYFMYPGVREAADEGVADLAEAVARIIEGGG